MKGSANDVFAFPSWPSLFLIAALGLLCGLAAGTAAADEQEEGPPESLFDKKYALALGGFFPYIESTFSLNGSDGGSGGDIDLQDDLGIENGQGSLWANFTWRFSPRHQLQVEWFQLDQDGETTAQTDLPPIGDLDILVGASLVSKIDFNLGRITYGYSIFRNDKSEFAFLVGAHVATTKVTVTASGSILVNGMPVAGNTWTESTSTWTFPLPHIGGQFSYEFAPRWATTIRAMVFAIDLGEYSGHLIELNGTVGYQLSKHFGIGGGIKYFNLNIQKQQATSGAEFDYQFLGPAIFGYASF